MRPSCCSYLLSHSRQREEILHSLTLPKPTKRVWWRNYGNESYKNTDHTIANRGCRNKSQFTADSKLRCEECYAEVHVVTGGMSNLNAHRDSKTCRENETANTLPPQKKEKSLLTFFSQKTIQQNAPRVASPPPVHAAPILPETIRDPRGVMPVSDCQGAVVTACSEFVPRNWTCPSCKSNSTKRRR